MRTRTLLWLLFGFTLLPACNDWLDIHAPADDLLDAATADEDAGAE